MSLSHGVCTAFLALLALVPSAGAEDWPCWRGPRGDGTSLETGVPTHWSDTKNVTWRIDIPGVGHASPIVIGGRVLTVSCLEETGERVLLCYDRRDGKLLWQQIVLS